MVRIVDYKKRKSAEGESFFALILQGGIEIVKSRTTGKSYAKSKTASMPSTFDENTCKALIGEELPGKIVKVPCEPYEFTIEATGEIITLDFTYEYFEDPESLEKVILEEDFVGEQTF